MKAMVLTGIGEMEMDTISDPEIINDNDVLIKMEAVGVCGSDIHYYINGSIGSQKVEYPFIVGHEGSGRIIKTGPEVKRLKPGDHIAFDPLIACGDCEQCLSDREHTCLNQKFLGCPDQKDGCLSEFIVLPESCCYKFSKEISFEEAVISEPLSIGIYANQLANLSGNEKVAILGFGPIGMSVKIAAEQNGIKSFFITDLISDRLRKAGFSVWTGNPDEQDIVKDIQEELPGGVDVVFECCGKQEALDHGIEILKPGGKLMIIGIPAFDRWSLNAEQIRRKEITIQNVRRQNHSVEKALELIGSKKVEIDAMITHRFSFSESPDAFDLVSEYKDGVMKAIINF